MRIKVFKDSQEYQEFLDKGVCLEKVIVLQTPQLIRMGYTIFEFAKGRTNQYPKNKKL